MKKTALFLLIAGCALNSYAVFVATGTPNSNTSAPAGNQGWSNMGIYNGAGAVYLGGGWFMTARHLGTASTVKLDSINYSVNSATWTSITNSDGSFADMRLFQVSDPGAISAPGIQVNTSALSSGESLTMIGYGRNVSSIITNTYNSKGQQTQVRYYEGTTSSMKWGYNQISGFSNHFESVGFGFFSDVFATTLSSGSAQALDKDSGGGVFIYDSVSGEYVLAGIMIGAVRYQDANGIFAATDTGTALQSSKTYAVDLSAYSDQINQVIPEPATGILLVGVAFVFGIIHRIRYMYQ